MDGGHLHVEAAAGRRRSSVVQVTRINEGIIAMPDDILRRMSVANPYLIEKVSEAQEQTEREHNMGVIEAVRLYPKAVMFSMILLVRVLLLSLRFH